MNKKFIYWIAFVFLGSSLPLSSCNLLAARFLPTPTSSGGQFNFPNALPNQTPLPTRTTFFPGEQVDYMAQDGDTLQALASRFNTSIEEILQANPGIPRAATSRGQEGYSPLILL